MVDSMHNDNTFNPFDPTEPQRDEALAKLLRQATGDVPAVDWNALASRISKSLPQRTTTWWSFAARWERRMLPLALAASLVGAVAIWKSAEPSGVASEQVSAVDVVSDVVQGTSFEDAARSFARSVTGDASLAESVAE
jgi:hypothetical protein